MNVGSLKNAIQNPSPFKYQDIDFKINKKNAISFGLPYEYYKK